MAKLARPQAFVQDGFSIRVKEALTKVYKVEGLDLTIEQIKPSGEEASLSHYSNPGTATFVALLKFLYIHRSKIPPIREPMSPTHNEFRDSAIILGMRFARMRFPIEYTHYTEGISLAVATVNYKEYVTPELQIDNVMGSLTFSLRSAQKMVEQIPYMYPGFRSFNAAYKQFLKDAQKNEDQIVDLAGRRRERGVQLQFPFMKELRQQK